MKINTMLKVFLCALLYCLNSQPSSASLPSYINQAYLNDLIKKNPEPISAPLNALVKIQATPDILIEYIPEPFTSDYVALLPWQCVTISSVPFVFIQTRNFDLTGWIYYPASAGTAEDIMLKAKGNLVPGFQIVPGQ